MRMTCDSAHFGRGATLSKRAVLLAVLSIFAVPSERCAQNQLVADKPWETKDWREWTRQECRKVLEESPWTVRHLESPSASSNYRWYEQVFTAQFHSALPIRHALTRLKQIEKRYDKMDAKRREAFDRELDAELGGDFSNSIVVRLTSRWTNVFKDDLPARTILLSGNTAAFELPGGRMVYATKFRLSGMDAEAVFPRFINGEPVIRPEDRVVQFTLGELSKVGFTPRLDRFVFKLDDMEYFGKREF